MGQNASLHLNYGDPGNKGAGKNRESCQECNLKNQLGLILPLRSSVVLPSMLRQIHMLIHKRLIANMCLALWLRIPLKRLYFNLRIHHINLTLDISLRVTRLKGTTIHRRLQIMHPLEDILRKGLLFKYHDSTDIYNCPSDGLWPVKSQVAGSSSYCLEVPGASTQAGLGVQIYWCNNTRAQAWAERSCLDQGVPVKVSDPKTLTKVVELLAQGRQKGVRRDSSKRL